ncbi:MAG TPA: hypothetical protein VGM76_19830, partial [Lacipirellulaceae bacterium]
MKTAQFKANLSGRSCASRLAALLLGSTALVAVGFSTPAAAASLNWTGTTSTDWFTAGNWSPSGTPAATDNVTIDTATANPTVIDGATASVGTLVVGQQGIGKISIVNGGVLTSGEAGLGMGAGSSGSAIVSGLNSKWETQGFAFVIGQSGTGEVVIENGATLLSRTTHIGEGSSSGVSSLTIQDGGSTWTGSGDLLLGQFASGSLAVKNGAVATVTGTTDAGVASGRTGNILVDGSNSHLTLGALILGQGGTGTLTISNGGAFDSGTTILGNLVGSNGTVTVQGAGSSWTSSG